MKSLVTLSVLLACGLAQANTNNDIARELVCDRINAADYPKTAGECFKVVKNGDFSKSAIQACASNFISGGPGDWVSCLVTIRNNKYNPGAAKACGERIQWSYSAGVECLRVTAGKEYLPEESAECEAVKDVDAKVACWSEKGTFPSKTGFN
jgi:hypothetical protein